MDSPHINGPTDPQEEYEFQLQNEIAKLKNESNKLRLELAEANAFVEGMEENCHDLLEAMKPFAELVSTTDGRIPTERLSFAHWHSLSKAHRNVRNNLSVEKPK